MILLYSSSKIEIIDKFANTWLGRLVSMLFLSTSAVKLAKPARAPFSIAVRRLLCM